MRNKIIRVLYSQIRKVMYRSGLIESYVPVVGGVSFGDFNRTSPFSRKSGYDRGGPVDRYYIESFLERESDSIFGRVLEVGDNKYTMAYGRENVIKSDILHIDDSNKRATFIGDLSNAPQIPDNTFDCFIMTQTLQYIFDFKKALRTCRRILKPGGTLLLTVPNISPISVDSWSKSWYWAFTDRAMSKIMAETFPNDVIGINHYGNVLAASAFLYGMGNKELTREQLDNVDPNSQIVITIKAV
jgi:SAM-dependent methyltransferase